jgi:hypothetical protein
MNKLAAWLNDHMFTCFWKKYLGIECPGCGMQRSVVALVNGDLKASLQYYPALLPMLILFILLLLHLKYKFRYGARFLQINFIFTVILILSNYFYKLL